jgi:hypothetical protein
MYSWLALAVSAMVRTISSTAGNDECSILHSLENFGERPLPARAAKKSVRQKRIYQIGAGVF